MADADADAAPAAGRWRGARRLASFAGTTGLSAAVTLAAVPVIIGGAGPYEWGVQAAIQAAAGLFGVLVAFGWGTTGPGEIASMPSDHRAQWYADSLVTRVYLLIVVYPVMAITMGVLNPDYIPLVLVATGAYLIPSVGAAWYFVGEARPGRLFRLDALPQIAGIALSLVAMLWTGSLVLTVTIQLAFNAGAVVLSGYVIIRSAPRPGIRVDLSPRTAFRRLAAQRHAVTTSATSALYVATPLLILNALAPGMLAVYAMGDRLFRFALTAFAPVLHFTQGWISEDGPAALTARMRRAIMLVPMVSATGALCIMALGPWAAVLLSQGEVRVGWALALPFAIVFFAVSLSQVLGLACLVQLGRSRDLAVSTLVGAVAGVPLLVAGALLFSAEGVAWALAVSEIVVVVYQAVKVRRELRVRRSHP